MISLSATKYLRSYFYYETFFWIKSHYRQVFEAFKDYEESGGIKSPRRAFLSILRVTARWILHDWFILWSTNPRGVTDFDIIKTVQTLRAENDQYF